MKIVFTSHAKDKLKSKDIKGLRINKKILIEVIHKPIAVNLNLNPHRSVGRLTEELSIAVIWKKENDIITVITFYPAEKGRYENKILRRR